MRDKTEIIIFDHLTGKKKRVVFKRKTLFVVKLFLFLFAISASAGIIIGISAVKEYHENKILLRENIRLKLDLSKYEKTTSLLQAEFLRIKNYTIKIKKLIHWNIVSKDRLARGDGDGQSPSVVRSELAIQIDNIFSDPLLHYEDIKVELENVLDHFREKLSYLTSIPSLWPVKGWVTSGFGYRISPFTHTLEFHEGLDIANAPGTPVVAPAEGYVLYTGWARGYGNVIILGHGYGITTIYGHLEKILVKQGQHVMRGEKIGLIGSTGRSTGPHLHYEVRVNGVPVNPLNYLVESF